MASKGLSFCSFFLFLWALSPSSSGSLVGFSYFPNRDSGITLPATDEVSLLKRFRLSSFVEDHRDVVPVHLYFSQLELKELLESKASAFSWLKPHLVNIPPYMNITSIVVGSNDALHPLLLPTLHSIHLALKSFKLEQKVKVAPAFSLSLLEISSRNHDKNLQGVSDFLRKSESFFVMDIPMDGRLNTKDHFVHVLIQQALSAQTILSDLGIPMVLKVQGSTASSSVERDTLVKKVVESIESHPLLKSMIDGIFIGVSSMEALEQRALSGEKEDVFPSFRRVLLDLKDETNKAAKKTLHDLMTPITNPVTSPITVPSTPGIVTIPSTNPVTVLPTNPTIPAVTVPSTNPVTTPITVPSTIPPPPAVIPITNPVTTPSTVPLTPPVTNPITPYPFPPPSGTPGGTTPVTVPVSPANSGQSWCVAKQGASDTALQLALDYSCGIGGVDCSAIQQTGSCYMPNTLHDHASYAFNSYYQNNPSPTSCDFGGSATLVNVNPIRCTNSVTTPINAPVSNPTPTSVTAPANVQPPPPVTPITNPVTTPIVPLTPPVTNPATNPFPPPSSIPGSTAPVTFPVSPASSGQSWCVAKTGALDLALQIGLDYACGIGGVDCSAIQQKGSCYIPNTLHDHASYAFNSYYQKNPTPSSCNFSGSATLVNTNPSSATCTYPASSSSVLNMGTPPGGGSATIFGSSNPIGSNSPVGSDNPTSTTTTSNSLSLIAGSPLLLALITTLFIT